MKGGEIVLVKDLVAWLARHLTGHKGYSGCSYLGTGWHHGRCGKSSCGNT